MRTQSPRVDLSGGTVAVIGCGAAAMATLQALRAEGANVRWFCRDLDVASTVLLASAPPGRLELSFADPLQTDYSEFVAVVADGDEVDAAIVERARSANTPINILGRPAISNFALPRAKTWFGGRWWKSQEIAA